MLSVVSVSLTKLMLLVKIRASFIKHSTPHTNYVRLIIIVCEPVLSMSFIAHKAIHILLLFDRYTGMSDSCIHVFRCLYHHS